MERVRVYKNNKTNLSIVGSHLKIPKKLSIFFESSVPVSKSRCFFGPALSFFYFKPAKSPNDRSMYTKMLRCHHVLFLVAQVLILPVLGWQISVPMRSITPYQTDGHRDCNIVWYKHTLLDHDLLNDKTLCTPLCGSCDKHH